MEEKRFIETLQKKAKEQARFSQGSPLPEWVKPFASVVGLHYWQVLLVISCVLALFISTWFFPSMYRNTQKTQFSGNSENLNF